MIQLDRLTKRYGEDAVVRELSLTIHTGELVVVLGSSGSGKTTTLKMINRLIEPTAGTVRLDGDRHIINPAARASATDRLRLPRSRPVPSHDRWREHRDHTVVAEVGRPAHRRARR